MQTWIMTVNDGLVEIEGPTHLVDHVGQLTLNLIRIDVLFAAKTDGCREFWDRDPCAADQWPRRPVRLGFFKPSREKDLA